MQTLKTYENTSGQLINSDKCHFIVHKNVFDTTKERTKRITRFKQRQGVTNYLGCPLFVGRPKISYSSDLISKFICMIKRGKPRNYTMMEELC